MKVKIMKLVVVAVAIAAGLYFSGALNEIGKAIILSFLEGKQGVVATIDNVSLAPPLNLSLDKINFASAYKPECKIIELDQIDVTLIFDKSKGYRLVPKSISLKGGVIYGIELAEHLKLRKEAQQKRREAAAVKAAAEQKAVEGKASAEQSFDDENAPTGEIETDSADQDKPSDEVVRRLILSDVTLDGGTISVNLFIARKEVAVRIKHIDADFMVKGDRFVINRLSWKMGPLNPTVQNREFDISLLQNPSKIKGIPKEVSGIFILASILLGGN